MWFSKFIEFFVIKQLQGVGMSLSIDSGRFYKCLQFSNGHFWKIVNTWHVRSNVELRGAP